MNILKINIDEKLLSFLEKRNLKKQFDKNLKYILSWDYERADFKIRKPKNKRMYYFRVNKQFRAFCLIKDETLEIIDINNHQNNK